MGEAADPRAAPAGLLFLREEDLRFAQDLIFLAARDLARTADRVLAAYELGRAHHRVLHFVGRNPGMTVGQLLDLLGVTKQSLSRVMQPLLSRELVILTPSRRDRRQRLLTLSQAGVDLERTLYEAQRERLVQAYRQAGGASVDGFRRVMRLLLDDDARAYIERRDPSRR